MINQINILIYSNDQMNSDTAKSVSKEKIK